jgi:hypothetical protein
MDSPLVLCIDDLLQTLRLIVGERPPSQAVQQTERSEEVN